MEHCFIGRQPILDREGKLYAYELLHRSPAMTPLTDGDRASSDMLLKVVWELGIPQISGTHPSFINMTRNLLMNRGLDALPPAGLVLEILEDVPADAALVRRVAQLRDRGFKIALDDFVHIREREPLVDLADIVKLDCLALDEPALRWHAEWLSRRKIRLLAEKVETHEMHQRTMALGFDYFQGYFFARPLVQKRSRILPNKLVLLELLARVNDPAVTPEELGAIIRGDVWTSITVLKWANGSIYGMRRAVESVERAIVVLGLQTIRNWVALLTMARMGTTPTELLKMLLVRARACELLASEAGRDGPEGYFTVGLLSALDIILQTDMAHALEVVRLSEEQKAAILSRAGDPGAALQAVIAMESGDLAQARFCGLAESDVTGCYLSALTWADALSGNGI
ncbi:MAG: HDOD domain-containing protein [Gammaproteobacteria bacterium]|nr:HDOD domain-containing protein [Gammaproteobacteria bacterium]